jgi:bifunctional DNA-binding transcriptional regulator/antitoxin component of YhaV-PrlF toxin-antitoxin module
MRVFEELAVLDSAGRLSIPSDYLEHFHIRRRVRLELVEGGILIRPPEPDLSEGEKDSVVPETGDVVDEGAPSQKRTWMERSKKFFLEVSSKFRKGRTNVK